MRDDLKTMFGENYNIKINSIDFSSQKKCLVLDITLICSNVNEDDLITFYPDGLEYVINESWNFTGFDIPLTLIHSLEIGKNN